MTSRPPKMMKQLWRKLLLSLCCLYVVTGQSGYYDNYPEYEDYQDYAGGEQGYDDHLYHDYAARQQEKVGGGGGYVCVCVCFVRLCFTIILCEQSQKR